MLHPATLQYGGNSDVGFDIGVKIEYADINPYSVNSNFKKDFRRLIAIKYGVEYENIEYQKNYLNRFDGINGVSWYETYHNLGRISLNEDFHFDYTQFFWKYLFLKSRFDIQLRVHSIATGEIYSYYFTDDEVPPGKISESVDIGFVFPIKKFAIVEFGWNGFVGRYDTELVYNPFERSFNFDFTSEINFKPNFYITLSTR